MPSLNVCKRTSNSGHQRPTAQTLRTEQAAEKTLQQPASLSVVSPSGGELEESSPFYRRMPEAVAGVQSFFRILLVALRP